jgi:ABC-type dipeptide/oligopeptide/nickel transport system ATPase component
MIIGLSGKIGSGKSTFSSELRNVLESKNYIVEERNFADKLKKITYELTGHYGYTQEDKNVYLPIWRKTVGEILQLLGTEVLRNHFDSEVWVKATISNLNPDTTYIIGDVRFLNEVEAIKSLGGIVIRLEGDPCNIRLNSKRDPNHSSETSLDNYIDFDGVYVNTPEKGLEGLRAYAEEVINNLKNKQNEKK